MEDYTYKDSGVQWLGKIPNHWKPMKLKKLIKLIPSNVDKRTEDDETHVELCNYVDVYYNDVIDTSIDFMEATANDGELKRFQLEVGDVIITKDSEDPNDIAVPAIVRETKERLLCGYHLSILRNNSHRLNNRFLFWTLKDEKIASQLHREATGITRWAIATKHIKNSIIPIPNPDEQKAIANYLEKACKNIDRVIEAKKKQLVLIEKYFNERVFEATTKGLKEDADLKNVSSNWISGIPEHWEVKKVKRFCNLFRGKFTHRPRNDPDYYGGEYPFIQTGSISKANKYINDYTQTLNDKGLAVSQMFPSGTLTMTIAANIGDVAILNFDACFPDSIVGFKPNHNMDLEYLYYLFKAVKQDFLSTAIVTTQLNLNIVRIGNVEIFRPPLKEQQQIVSRLNILSKTVVELKNKIQSQINSIEEYRNSLIHECVTGKKKVFEGESEGIKAEVA